MGALDFEKLTWAGRPIDDLPREDLIHVIAHLIMERRRYPDLDRAYALGRVAMLKRGETDWQKSEASR